MLYAFCWYGLSLLVPLEGIDAGNKYKVILNDQLNAMMKLFYPDKSGVFQDHNVAIYSARGLTLNPTLHSQPT